MTMASPDQQAEHAAQEAKTWQLSVETRGSRLVHVLRTMRAPVCLWSVVTHRWIGTGAVRTLWKSQSSVTDKAIMALLCAFKAIIKCDWVCPDATPTKRWWGVYRQQIMIGEADGGNTHRIIAFSFQTYSEKKNLATGSQATPNKLCYCLQAKSGNFLWYMTHIDIGMFTFPGRGEKCFHVENLMQATGRSNGNRCKSHVFYLPNKISFFI